MPISQTNRLRNEPVTWARLAAHQSPDLPITDTSHPSPLQLALCPFYRCIS